MKGQIPTPVVVAMIVLALVIVGFFGWRATANSGAGRPNVEIPPPPKETEGMEARPRPAMPGSGNAAQPGTAHSLHK